MNLLKHINDKEVHDIIYDLLNKEIKEIPKKMIPRIVNSLGGIAAVAGYEILLPVLGAFHAASNGVDVVNKIIDYHNDYSPENPVSHLSWKDLVFSLAEAPIDFYEEKDVIKPLIYPEHFKLYEPPDLPSNEPPDLPSNEPPDLPLNEPKKPFPFPVVIPLNRKEKKHKKQIEEIKKLPSQVEEIIKHKKPSLHLELDNPYPIEALNRIETLKKKIELVSNNKIRIGVPFEIKNEIKNEIKKKHLLIGYPLEIPEEIKQEIKQEKKKEIQEIPTLSEEKEIKPFNDMDYLSPFPSPFNSLNKQSIPRSNVNSKIYAGIHKTVNNVRSIQESKASYYKTKNYFNVIV